MGANLFLVIGGLGFFFRIMFILNALEYLHEAAIILSVILVAVIATFASKSGVFEQVEKNNRTLSYFFILGAVPALFVSFKYRGDILFAGTLPFVYLILLRYGLKRKLRSKTT